MTELEGRQEMPEGERAAIAALRDDYDRLCREAPVPTAGLVWWRASIRARAEAAEAVDKPLALAHGIAVAGIVGVACALLGVVWRLVPPALGWAAPAPSSTIVLTGLAVAVGLVLTPLALVLAFLKDQP